MLPDKVAAARQMYDSKDYTVEAIAKVLGVSRASIYRHLARPGADPEANGADPGAGPVPSPVRRTPPPRAARRS